MPTFDETLDPRDGWCEESDHGLSQSLTDTPFGRFGCDTPTKLAHLMTEKLASIEPDVDIILVSGDFIAHGYAVQKGQEDKFEELKEAIHHVFVTVLATNFPNAVILPAIGNNDIKYHYLAPRQDDEAQDYYQFLSDMMFRDIPGNKNIDRAQIDKTFKSSGFFRYDHHPTCTEETCLSIISFNSLYYAVNRGESEEDIMQRQIDWLDAMLGSAQDHRKFIIFMHIYPGHYQVFGETYFWDDESTAKFVNVIEKHSDRVTIILGAHTHFSDIRINLPTQENDSGELLKEEPIAKFSLLATPSFSLSNYNNPGFTQFNIKNNSLQDIRMTFMNAHQFPKSPEQATFNVFDFNRDLGMKEW
eukprot:CAMPEP_0205821594 /NCGR_PEP_ID=MMETSP0206-20130828/8529_1 /ASSEMBLY_ACC=CAM_ASM_000279 /TAXON_ID=36767 /ORGANISM="Euplotes focardii, Strain TN1" /LENGTH=358 /DNA_ID=CAMNT_0053117175 /DNA_START=80 /DNA_END=1153 /DNA_ORIENTATION=-